MALINCPECGRILSDKAKQCPSCGVDMKTIKKLLKENDIKNNEFIPGESDSSDISSKSETPTENVSKDANEGVATTAVIKTDEPGIDVSERAPVQIKKQKERKPISTKTKIGIILGTIILVIVMSVLFVTINWNKFKENGTFESIYDAIGICLSHDYVDANCEKPKTCTICGKEIGNALGHDYQLSETVEPTCTEKGLETYSCSRCKDSYTEELEALGHEYEGEPEIIEPTCTEDGNKINKCIRCDKTIEEIIPATGHELTEATCTAASVCINCGEEVGSALGHTTMNGTCDRCGDYIVEPIVFSGHGDTVLSDINVPIGQYRVLLTNTGSSNFIIYAYSSDGKKDIWMNEIGPFSGFIYTQMDLTDGIIEMRSNGDWTVKFEQIEENGTSKIQGKGYAVTPYFTLEDGQLVLDIDNKNANSNFITKLVDENGRVEIITNEIGSYSGQKLIKAEAGKKYCLWVRSDGDWSFDFGIEDKVTYVSNKE